MLAQVAPKQVQRSQVGLDGAGALGLGRQVAQVDALAAPMTRPVGATISAGGAAVAIVSAPEQMF